MIVPDLRLPLRALFAEMEIPDLCAANRERTPSAKPRAAAARALR
jgi:hypothetical protein